MQSNLDFFIKNNSSEALTPRLSRAPNLSSNASHNKSSCSLNQSGFSLFELLITLAIVGFVSLIALPSLSKLIADQRINTMANTLMSSIKFARQEAISRNRFVSICPIQRENLTCNTSNHAEWQHGWIVFTDFNENGDYNLDSATPDQLIRQFAGSQRLIISKNATPYIRYQASGRSKGSGTTLSIDTSETSTATRLKIIINTIGRPRME